MVAHDVSHELRGYHGRWSREGALKRVVDSATAGGRGKTVEQHQAAIDELKPGQARGVNGFKVTHMGDKGYRVTMPGETRHYQSSHDAARAAHAKQHVEVGKAPEAPAGPAPGTAEFKRRNPYQREQIKRKYTHNQAREAWMGKNVEITHGVAAGKSGKVISADKYGVTVDTGDGHRETPGHGQFREAKAGAPAPRPGRTFEQAHKEWQSAFKQTGRSNNINVLRAASRDMGRLEEEMRGMGARRQIGGQGWEMPPKPGSPEHARELMNRDLQGLFEELHGTGYSPKELVSIRESDVRQQLKEGGNRITIKVPSGSEVSMRAGTARYLLFGEQPGAGFERGTAAEALARSKRASQQANLAAAAARRGITNRRKMA